MMSENKKKGFSKSDPLYVCAGAAVGLALIGLIVYKIEQNRMNIAIDNIGSYYGSIDGGLFLTQQEYLLRRALLFSSLITVIVGIVLLIALYIYMSRMIPVSRNREKATNAAAGTKTNKRADRSGLNEAKTDLHELIGRIRESYSHKMEEKKIEFTVDDVDVEFPVVMCDVSAVENMIKYMLNNAYRSAAEGGRIYLALKQFFVSDEGYGIYEITVEDDGVDNPLDGLLLGADLEDAREIAESMDGELETETEKGVGNGVTVRLDLKAVKEDTK